MSSKLSFTDINAWYTSLYRTSSSDSWKPIPVAWG